MIYKHYSFSYAGGDSLHAPLVERLLELPMDIHEGRLDGELRLRCVDPASWQFPEFYGSVRVRGEGVGRAQHSCQLGGVCVFCIYILGFGLGVMLKP